MFYMENQQGPAVQHRGLCSILCNNLVVTRGKDGGRDSQGAWDGHGHTAGFNMENQQGPAVQHRVLCSILCNNLIIPRGKDRGRDSQGVWDGHGHTAVFHMENQQGPADSTGNPAQCHVAAWMGGEFGGEMMHVYVWLNPFAVHRKL